MVVLVVLRLRAGLGQMAVTVSIAVRSGLSCPPGAVGAGAVGSAPVRDLGVSSSLISNLYINNQF